MVLDFSANPDNSHSIYIQSCKFLIVTDLRTTSVLEVLSDLKKVSKFLPEHRRMRRRGLIAPTHLRLILTFFLPVMQQEAFFVLTYNSFSHLIT